LHLSQYTCDYEEALEAINKALELAPNESNYWNRKGIILDNLGRYEGAQIAFKEESKLK
jgi:Flp pilus assembly protein TadD